jgi:hypothetical protein
MAILVAGNDEQRAIVRKSASRTKADLFYTRFTSSSQPAGRRKRLKKPEPVKVP